MYKKILAVVLSSLMLAQSVSAASLYDFVSTKFPAHILTNVGGDMIFDYGKVREDIANNIPAEIETSLDALVAVQGSPAYQDSVVSTSNSFNFKVSLDMENVRDEIEAMYTKTKSVIQLLSADESKSAAENLATYQDLENKFDNSVVSGNFEVTVSVDNHLTGFDVTSFVLRQGNDSDSQTFTLDGVPSWNPTTRVAVFSFKMKDNINIKTLHDNRATMLADLYMTADVTATTKRQALDVTAQLTAASTTFTDRTDSKAYGFINYTSNPDTATVVVRASSGRDGIDLEDDEPPVDDPGATEAPKAWLVVTEGNLDVTVDEKDGEYFVDIDGIEVPEKDGFVVEGIYLDPVFTEATSGTLQIYQDTYLYPKYINVQAPSQFISDEHILYIVGYPDGEVKPNNNITREEVVAALYRLLKPEFRATLDTNECVFPDVKEGRWSYESIAAFANAGYIVGDLEGRFNPGNPITRAEFVTIINKFASELPKHSGSHFTDIAGHWAEQSIISSAVDWSWVTGYEDNTFRPNSRITRAEAVTIINKMLVRYGDVNSEFAKQWPDLDKSDWYYGAMIEATTEHKFTRDANGWSETWIQ